MIVKKPMTLYDPEDLLAMPDAQGYELVEGQLVERNVGALSGLVEGYVYDLLLTYARERDAGLAWTGTMGYQINPAHPKWVRKPDVSFIRKEKLSKEIIESGFIKVAPDLVVEVLSPNDLAYEVDRKIAEYFDSGVSLIWIVNPETRIVRVYRRDGTASVCNEQSTLDGEEVLPGFRCPVTSCFPDRARLKALGLG